MANFCGDCGYPLNEAFGFCGNCGSNQKEVPSVATPGAVAHQIAGARTAAALPPKSSGILKIVLVLLALLLVGGALAVRGLYYAAHKISQKAHGYSAKVSGRSEGRGGLSSNGKRGEDVCRLLTKEAVSQAIGMPIAATSSSDGPCAYLVKAKTTYLTAKHIASMLGKRSANARTQGQIKRVAGGFLSTIEAEAKEPTQDANSNTVILSVSEDSNSAAAQMKPDRRVLAGSFAGDKPPGRRGL